MSSPRVLARCLIPTAVSLGLIAAASAQSPQSQAPVFRGGTFLVPVDVRVLDNAGRPIPGLTSRDFTILEDDVPQEIRQFSEMTLTPDRTDDSPLRRVGSSAAAAPQNRRVFLIVLGRGRLQPPSRGVDAALRLVREQLLPQDLVAVFAYNRATDFTADRAYVTAILERFNARHEQIEATIRQTSFEDIDYVYGADIPASIQAQVDALFSPAGAPPPRTPPGAVVTTAEQIRRDEVTARNAALGAAIMAQRRALGGFRSPEQAGTESSGDMTLLNAGFADFIRGLPRGRQDLTKLYQAIEYLRHVDGEKHLIFLTERGMSLPRLEDHTSVAAMANDARVVIHPIQTGGLPDREVGAAAPFHQTFAITSLQTVAELTGGVASIYAYANRAMDRIVSATSASYLLGYAPINTNFDGSYRRITVKVGRRGARVLWRHGYFARDPKQPFDQRRALTYNRIASAMNLGLEMPDIKFNLDADEVRDGQGTGLQVSLQIDPSRLHWTTDAGNQTAVLTIAMFAADRDGEIVGEHWQEVPLRLSADLFERARKTGLSYKVRLDLKDTPVRLKVVVYDFGSDLLGTGSTRLR